MFLPGIPDISCLGSFGGGRGGGSGDQFLDFESPTRHKCFGEIQVWGFKISSELNLFFSCRNETSVLLCLSTGRAVGSLLRLQERMLFRGQRPWVGYSVSAQILGYSKPLPSAPHFRPRLWRPSAACHTCDGQPPWFAWDVVFRGNGVFQRSSQTSWSPCTAALISGAGGDPVKKATALAFTLTSCISGFHFIAYGLRAY